MNVQEDVKQAVKEPVAIRVMILARLLHQGMEVARIVLVDVQNLARELVLPSVH